MCAGVRARFLPSCISLFLCSTRSLFPFSSLPFLPLRPLWSIPPRQRASRPRPLSPLACSLWPPPSDRGFACAVGQACDNLRYHAVLLTLQVGDLSLGVLLRDGLHDLDCHRLLNLRSVHLAAAGTGCEDAGEYGGANGFRKQRKRLMRCVRQLMCPEMCWLRSAAPARSGSSCPRCRP